MSTLSKAVMRLGALALVLGLAAPAVAQDKPFKLIVTDLETPLVPNSVMDLALQGGYFEREGVNVELVRVQQTPSAIAAIQSGEGDMANIGTDALLQLQAQGNDSLKAVMSPNKSLPYLIAGKDEFNSVADLAGHSFGVGRVGSLDYSLSLKVFEGLGLDTDKLDIVSVGQPNVRAQALAAGRIDSTTVSIGTWLSVPDKTGLKVIVPQDEYYEQAPAVSKVNVVNNTVLAERRDDVEAVIRAIIKASRDFAADPQKWVDAMAKARPDISVDNLKELADNYKNSWSVNGGMNRKELDYTVGWLYEGEDFKNLPEVPFEKWADLSLVDDVLADIGKADGEDQPVR
jgi:NitT/TauT family transport system substrate-binding protein